MPNPSPNQSTESNQPSNSNVNLNVPDNVNFNVTERKIDPLSDAPAKLRWFAQFSAFGIISVLFVWLVYQTWGLRDDGFKQAEINRAWQEKITDKFQQLLDRMEDRIEKNVEARDAQNKMWLKSIQEHNTLEHDKTRLEMSTMTASLKNLIEQVKMIK